MVATVASSTDIRYRTYPNDDYNGVVRVSSGGYSATGTLLFDGRAILTAAHLFQGGTEAATVTFETSSGTQTLSTAQVMRHRDYDGMSNNDLAIVWLSAPAPATAHRYDIYRGDDELGQSFTMVGYGIRGTGDTGASSSASAMPIRLKAENRFDADASTLENLLGPGLAWSPLAGTQLIADFDNGKTVNDAMGQLIHRADLGLGLDEGVIAQGDSGGPAFIDGQIAGVASYIASLGWGSLSPDVDDTTNSSFGEIAAWQRASAYQQWIDQAMRDRYAEAPRTPEEVSKAVAEGDSGTIHAYFLLQFTGARSDPDDILSVDYVTRDGTAKAGSDYLAVSGVLHLYPGETQAVIPVEVIGDATGEPDEVFYLDVTNPVGGGLGEGVIKLTAVRTILDDDGWAG
ncbi:MAG: trypsin-like serine protease [Halothiobacillaceae bacterium]|nr:MAG: trypsin-like serine protease [Halothiobacillaceae bacterium]